MKWWSLFYYFIFVEKLCTPVPYHALHIAIPTCLQYKREEEEKNLVNEHSSTHLQTWQIYTYLTKEFIKFPQRIELLRSVLPVLKCTTLEKMLLAMVIFLNYYFSLRKTRKWVEWEWVYIKNKIKIIFAQKHRKI